MFYFFYIKKNNSSLEFTNIKYDPCRTAKDLQISTETGRYHIAVPAFEVNVHRLD